MLRSFAFRLTSSNYVRILSKDFCCTANRNMIFGARNYAAHLSSWFLAASSSNILATNCRSVVYGLTRSLTHSGRSFSTISSSKVTSSVTNKVCLVILDGWGITENTEGNAVHNADTPVMDALTKSPEQYITLEASGLEVGLPDGLMGNSEIGHFSLGSGRVVYQDIVKINKAVKEKSFTENKNFVEMCKSAKIGNGRLHFLGLVSDGGVHSHIEHLFCLIQCAKELGVPETFVHFFADGRDTSPTSGVTYVQQVLDKLKKLQYGSLATVIGRYYAMDRDKRYERNKIAFEGLIKGVGYTTSVTEVINVIKKRYFAEGDARETDEFLKPMIVDPEGCIQDGDTLMFFNFRADRMRQIVQAFGIKPQFETDKPPENINICTMTEYKKEYDFPILFPSEVPKNVLAEWFSLHGIRQYHVAETEKYAHVTFFFNGGQEARFEGEDRKLIPSPKVATYDLQPEMSCDTIANEVCAGIKSGKYPFVMCNIAAPDMVGHTGVYEAAVKACNATDVALGKIKDECEECGYALFVTADHGNSEKMLSEEGGPHTAHTTHKVPFVIGNTKQKLKLSPDYTPALCDVATTILDFMGMKAPKEMTGRSLLANN